MPYTATTWVDGITTLGPTNLNHIEAGLALTSPAYGTSLPGSPADGQEAILVDSTSAPTYQWRFRYNNGSSSAYKWEFVGGTEVYVETAGTDTSTSSTVANLSNGPSFTVPRAGDWLIEVQAINQSTVVDDACSISAGDSATPTSQFITSSYAQGAVAGRAAAVLAKGRGNGIGSGVTIATKGWATGGGTVTWMKRRLSVIPVRVS